MRAILTTSLVLLISFSYGQKLLVPYKFGMDGNDKTHIELHGHGLTVISENLEVLQGLLVFDVEIINDSESEIDVNHLDIALYSSDQKIGKNHGGSFIEYPLEGRDVENFYERKIRRGERNKKLMGILSAGLLIFDAVETSSSFYEGFDNGDAVRGAVIATSFIAMEAVDQKITRSQIQSDEDLRFLGSEYFHSGVLEPGQSVRGKLFFPSEVLYQYYQLEVPIETSVFVFNFREAKSADRRLLR